MASLTLDWLQLASLLGAIQGVFLAGVLLAQRRNRVANRLLAALMAVFTVYLAATVYYSAGLVGAYPHLFGISYPLPWIIGPLFYLYALAASDRTWRATPRYLVHLVPIAIAVAAATPTYTLSGAAKVAMYQRWAAGDVPPVLAAIDPLKYVSGIGYSIATVWYLRRHGQRIRQSYSNTARVNLVWLVWLAAAGGSIWVMATVLRVTHVGGLMRDEHISLAIALLIYAIGYMGLRQPEIFQYESLDQPSADERSARTTYAPAVAAGAASRYERSGLGESEAAQLEHRLLDVMDTRLPWKDSELTLADLAASVGSTPHKLSEVLNTQVGQTFYDFVNGYRVREVQRRIRAGDAQRLKMLAIALDAGFASKSTFNQAFKKHTSQTPSHFRQAVGA